MFSDQRESAPVRAATIAMSISATILLEQALLDPGEPRLLAAASTLGLLIAPMIAASILLDRRERGVRPFQSGMAPLRRGTAAAALAGAFFLPFAIALVRKALTGQGTMLEVMLLGALRNLGLGLTALAFRSFFARLSALVSLFIVVVATPLGGDVGDAITWPSAAFALSGIAWLAAGHWKSLGITPSAKPKRFRFASPVWLGILLICGAIAAAVGPDRAAIALAELLPTSGGTGESDPDARSGVGDGDHEVAADENPQSVGFTESEVFLETDRPSLYDAFNEAYGEPFKPKNQEKMIAIGPQNVQEQEERPSENLQAGREFSAVRKKPDTRSRKPKQRDAKALVYVKGSVPLHMPLATFCVFDGREWNEEPCCNRDFPVEVEPGGSWMSRPRQLASFLRESVDHQVKIGLLSSSAMPMPPHVERFKVGAVNRVDFFDWAQFGIVRMTDRTVPAGTVIQSSARTVDPERLRETTFPRPHSLVGDRHTNFQNDYTPDPRILALAEAWSQGVPHGWRQIEAIVAEMRGRHVHDREAVVPEGCPDVVEHFLLDAKRGPDYLFASSTAVLLRMLGYPTRLVSGLYAAPEDYDPTTRHTLVKQDDVHVWLEVRTPEGLWVAVEPTPGYELLPPIRPWSEQIARSLAAGLRWARERSIPIVLAVLGILVLVARSRECLDAIATLVYRAVSPREGRARVLRALRLIEARSRWAGAARPPAITPRRWYRLQAEPADERERTLLERLTALAEWAAHAPAETAAATEDELRALCDRVVAAWTLSRFRDARSMNRRKAATT
ncbi:MAG: transglutaminase-like domain-containing protein [Isosphaeraceae bacterium]|nr:transglutaminase-like domain-containing protein [Isosphaeraceae bacterium]